MSIHTTYPANVIETTDMVQQIQQFKFTNNIVERKRSWYTTVAYPIRQSVFLSVCPENVGLLWQNGLLDPDAVWGG